VRHTGGIAIPAAVSDNFHIMTRIFLPAIGIGMMLAAGSLRAQTPTDALAFEVASIKPSEPITPALAASGKLHLGMKIDAARVDIGNFALMQLICKAYEVKPYQVSGPSWLLTGQKFDIVANLPHGATKEQVPQMLQALLAERFKLAIHRDTKEQAVYAMVIGKGGIKMKETEAAAAPDGSAPDGSGPNGSAPNPAVTGSSSLSISQTKGGAVVSDGQGKQQKMTVSPDGKMMRMEASKISMAELAEGLSPISDHPIVDMTGLKGNYQVTLEISMQELMAAARAAGAAIPAAAPGGADAGKPADAASDPGGSLFTAIQALGLKLEPRKSPLAMIVVDHVEKMPTEN
jgi:uncharacterized protein (TIGR03435 family)